MRDGYPRTNLFEKREIERKMERGRRGGFLCSEQLTSFIIAACFTHKANVFLSFLLYSLAKHGVILAWVWSRLNWFLCHLGTAKDEFAVVDVRTMPFLLKHHLGWCQVDTTLKFAKGLTVTNQLAWYWYLPPRDRQAWGGSYLGIQSRMTSGHFVFCQKSSCASESCFSSSSSTSTSSSIWKYNTQLK